MSIKYYTNFKLQEYIIFMKCKAHSRIKKAAMQEEIFSPCIAAYPVCPAVFASKVLLYRRAEANISSKTP